MVSACCSWEGRGHEGSTRAGCTPFGGFFGGAVLSFVPPAGSCTPGCFPLSSPCFRPGALSSWISGPWFTWVLWDFLSSPRSPATRRAGHGGSSFRASDQTAATREHPCLSPPKKATSALRPAPRALPPALCPAWNRPRPHGAARGMSPSAGHSTGMLLGPWNPNLLGHAREPLCDNRRAPG